MPSAQFIKKIGDSCLWDDMFFWLLGIHWRNYCTNASVLEEVERKIGIFELLLGTVKRRKLQWFGHVTRRPGTVAHTAMHGDVEGQQGRFRLGSNWVKYVTILTEESTEACIQMAGDRGQWRRTCWCPNGQMAMDVTWLNIYVNVISSCVSWFKAQLLEKKEGEHNSF